MRAGGGEGGSCQQPSRTWRQRAGSAWTGLGTCTSVSMDGPGGLPASLEGKQLLSNLPGAGDSSKEHPTAPLFSLKPPSAAQVPFAQNPWTHEGHGPHSRVLCTSPSTGPAEPEGPTSGNTHSSTPPALNTPRSPNRRDRSQPSACCCSGEPQHFAEERAVARGAVPQPSQPPRDVPPAPRLV